MNKNEQAPNLIYLLRHAHAAWARPGQRDYDRPLDDLGIEDANLMGTVLAKFEHLPQIILCSSARRCRQTCEIIQSHLSNGPIVEHDDGLYENDHDYYVSLLARQTNRPVLLIGHNPMMEDTAHQLSASTSKQAGKVLQKGFPTAGLAVIEISGDFSTLSEGGMLTGFSTPKNQKTKAGKASD
tara:strand:+ start:52035 stop:52583 length:549 start_codon:yes stop_codon:yes gene_type:complete